MSPAVTLARIRARYAEALAAKAHVCTSKTLTQEELRAGGWRIGDTCRAVVTDKKGKPQFYISIGCSPIVDDEWFEDVAALLGEVDRLAALVDAAVKFRIGAVDVFLVPSRELPEAHERWSAFDGVNAKAFPTRDEAIAHARKGSSLPWWRRPTPPKSEWPKDGTCRVCGSAPRDGELGVCMYCLENSGESEG